MAHNAHEYRQVDLTVGQQINDEMRAQGTMSYPAICMGCHGARVLAGEPCQDCDGTGSYEVAICSVRK